MKVEYLQPEDVESKLKGLQDYVLVLDNNPAVMGCILCSLQPNDKSLTHDLDRYMLDFWQGTHRTLYSTFCIACKEPSMIIHGNGHGKRVYEKDNHFWLEDVNIDEYYDTIRQRVDNLKLNEVFDQL